jgi:hypothetical protein
VPDYAFLNPVQRHVQKTLLRRKNSNRFEISSTQAAGLDVAEHFPPLENRECYGRTCRFATSHPLAGADVNGFAAPFGMQKSINERIQRLQQLPIRT